MDYDTPDTNEAQFGTGRVSVDFARRLERERDEARAIAAQLRDKATGRDKGDPECWESDEVFPWENNKE